MRKVSKTSVMLSFDLLAIFTVKCNDSVSFSFLLPCFLFSSLGTKYGEGKRRNEFLEWYVAWLAE